MDAFVLNTFLDQFIKVAKVNIVTGEYDFYKNDPRMKEMGLDAEPDITSYIRRIISESLIHLGDADDYQRYTDLAYLRTLIFSGKKTAIRNIRCRYEGRYRWMIFEVLVPDGCSRENPWVLFTWRESEIPYSDGRGTGKPVTGFNRKLEKILEQQQDAEQFLRVIAPRFKGVYFVDLEKNTLRHIFIPDYYQEMLDETGGKYREALRLYTERLVRKEYRAGLIQLCDFSYVRRMLEKKDRIEISYQKQDGEWLRLEIMDFYNELARNNETLWIFFDKNYE